MFFQEDALQSESENRAQREKLRRQEHRKLVEQLRLIVPTKQMLTSEDQEEDDTNKRTTHSQAVVMHDAIQYIKLLENALRVKDTKQRNKGPLQVLVIDDDIITHLFAQSFAKSLNFEITEATGGRMGIEMLRQRPYDLVFLDIVMPDVDGFHVLDSIKKEILPNIPTICISSDASLLSMSSRLGAHSIIKKPLQKEIVQFELKNALKLVEKNRKGDLWHDSHDVVPRLVKNHRVKTATNVYMYVLCAVVMYNGVRDELNVIEHLSAELKQQNAELNVNIHRKEGLISQILVHSIGPVHHAIPLILQAASKMVIETFGRVRLCIGISSAPFIGQCEGVFDNLLQHSFAVSNYAKPNTVCLCSTTYGLANGLYTEKILLDFHGYTETVHMTNVSGIQHWLDAQLDSPRSNSFHSYVGIHNCQTHQNNSVQIEMLSDGHSQSTPAYQERNQMGPFSQPNPHYLYGPTQNSASVPLLAPNLLSPNLALNLRSSVLSSHLTSQMLSRAHERHLEQSGSNFEPSKPVSPCGSEASSETPIANNLPIVKP